MLGAYFGFYSLTALGAPFSVAFMIAGFGTAAVAVILERLAYKPLRDRRAPFLYFIITAMGASIFIDNSVIATIGPTPKTFPTELLPDFLNGSVGKVRRWNGAPSTSAASTWRSSWSRRSAWAC
jgi:branched-subunit amino acid ABC-type transport system permease component